MPRRSLDALGSEELDVVADDRSAMVKESLSRSPAEFSGQLDELLQTG